MSAHSGIYEFVLKNDRKILSPASKEQPDKSETEQIMVNAKIASYGTWKSPITSDLIVAEVIRLGQVRLKDQDMFWLEMRPGEGGRNVLMRRTRDGEILELTPPEFNVRSRAHEYGGGSICPGEGQVYFCNASDQRIYAQSFDALPRAITPKKNFRFADAILDRKRKGLVCVREDHTHSSLNPENSLVFVSLDETRDIQTLSAGHDFYSSPGLNPAGTRLCWLSWDHPNMPWDCTELWVADIDDHGSLSTPAKVAGGAKESIFQPRWSPDGALYFVSDRTGWWNLYCCKNDQVSHLVEREAEFGLPQWVFGMSTYDFVNEELIACSFFEQGRWQLALLEVTSGSLDLLDLPFTHIESVRAEKGHIAFIGGCAVGANAVVLFDIKTRSFEVVRRSAEIKIDSTYFSRPEELTFTTDGGKQAHASFYPPQNRDYCGPETERPPLIVKSHGGPTSAASTTLELKTQFWTSRGFAVLDVNYGGSTGYGREYRERLDKNWGIVDVNDCINGAKYLVEKGLVDGGRMAIAGGSAGGYTTLSALTFHDFFNVGASYYGISDLEAMAKETHKFESRYLDRLVGPYPEQKNIYRERSPIHHTDKLSCPVILMQGLEDKVVPPNQAEKMVTSLRKKGLPVAYIEFEGEQHGFRKAESIKTSLEAELYFYARIFGFETADELTPVPIDNLRT